jgi:PhoPQ-activated pathogenicity-related protein
MLSRFTISQRLPSFFLVVLSLFLGSPMALGQPLAPLTNPRTALEEYVRAPDEHYSFVVADVEDELLLTRHTIRMQSQAWNPGGEVLNRTIWEHGIALLVPRFIATDRGLLLIAGGSNDDELIGDDEVEAAARVALLSGSVVAVLFGVQKPVARVDVQEIDAERLEPPPVLERLLHAVPSPRGSCR